jgi:hypothetical protein
MLVSNVQFVHQLNFVTDDRHRVQSTRMKRNRQGEVCHPLARYVSLIRKHRFFGARLSRHSPLTKGLRPLLWLEIKLGSGPTALHVAKRGCIKRIAPPRRVSWISALGLKQSTSNTPRTAHLFILSPLEHRSEQIQRDL